MTCPYCDRPRVKDWATCGDKFCIHKSIEDRRELREVAKNYPELAERAGFKVRKKLSEEESLKELGY